MRLLPDQSLEKSLVLLYSADRLCCGVKLCGQCLERICVGRLLVRKLADILELEGRQPRVLLVEGPLCVVELLLQEVGCAFSRPFAGTQVLTDEKRSNLAADLLCRARIRRLERYKEPRHTARSLRRVNLSDLDGLARHIDALIHGVNVTR